MILSPTNLVIIALAVIVVIAVINWLFRKDDAIEERRKNMMKLYSRLQELGLERLAGFAQAYVVGDYSGLYREAHTLLHDIMDPVKANELLAKSFFKQLERRITDPIESIKINQTIAAASAKVRTISQV